VKIFGGMSTLSVIMNSSKSTSEPKKQPLPEKQVKDWLVLESRNNSVQIFSPYVRGAHFKERFRLV
jgi:hypothetical protein